MMKLMKDKVKWMKIKFKKSRISFIIFQVIVLLINSKIIDLQIEIIINQEVIHGLNEFPRKQATKFHNKIIIQIIRQKLSIINKTKTINIQNQTHH